VAALAPAAPSLAEEPLLLCCAVLQQKKTGLAEVPLHQLAGHFYALSRRHGARRRRPRLASLCATAPDPCPPAGAVSVASPAELVEMVSRLRDGRLLASASSADAVQLLARPAPPPTAPWLLARLCAQTLASAAAGAARGHQARGVPARRLLRGAALGRVARAKRRVGPEPGGAASSR